MKIAIVGSAMHCIKAPFDDPSWEIWGCNKPGLPRWDRWFDLHTADVIDTHPGHREWLSSQDKPVVTQENYPLASMVEKYGTWFFTSTISYMLAMALEQPGLEAIGLWGVDLAHDSEYLNQRPGCRFFMTLAHLRGIPIHCPPEAEVLVPGKLYAFSLPHPMERKLAARETELRTRQAELTENKNRMVMTLAALKGALDITVAKEQLPGMITETQAQIAQADRDILMFEGAIQEIVHESNNWLTGV